MGDKETTDKEINDVAALAESIQPTGNTLSSTSVSFVHSILFYFI